MSEDKKKSAKKSNPVAEVPVEKETKDFKSQLSTFSEKSQSIISKYLLLFAVAISSVTIIGALLISQHYINPTRDSAVYEEGESQISFKEIDQEKLNTLQESLDNSSVEVETDFVPNRNNPFAE